VSVCLCVQVSLSLSFSLSLSHFFRYENLDGLGNFSAQKTLSTTANRCGCVFAADLDNDGDMDVLFVAGVGDKVGW